MHRNDQSPAVGESAERQRKPEHSRFRETNREAFKDQDWITPTLRLSQTSPTGGGVWLSGNVRNAIDSKLIVAQTLWMRTKLLETAHGD